jgi:PrtD family type I secretion system ABC transporter
MGLAVVVLLSFFINLMKLAVPIYIFQLLDRVIASRSVETLVMLTIIIVCAVLAGGLAEIVRRWMLMRWGAWIGRQFGRQLLLASLEGRSRRRPSAALRDLRNLQQFVSGSAAPAWLDVVWAPVFLLIVYLIHPLIALITVVGLLIMGALGAISEHMTRATRSAATKATEDRSDWLATAERRSETIGTLRIVRHLADRWHRSSSAGIAENLSTRLLAMASAEVMRFIENVTRIGTYGVGVWLVLAGELTVGGVIAGALLARMAAGSVRQAMKNWQKLASARSAYRRIKVQLSEDPATPTVSLDPQSPLPLHFEDVSHRYPDRENSVFRNITLSLLPGEVLYVIGPPGSGKSTFSRIAVGYLQPRSGVVRLGDADITRHAPEQLCRYVGYLEQEVQLFRGTIGENIAGLDRGDPRMIKAAAELANIHDFIRRLPRDYDTPIEDETDALCVSERRRIGLARALYGRPSLIVLDEPDTGPDAATLASLKQAICACRDWGGTVVVTSQSEALAEISDKVLLLGEEARVRILGSREEVQERLLGHDPEVPKIVNARHRR